MGLFVVPYVSGWFTVRCWLVTWQRSPDLTNMRVTFLDVYLYQTCVAGKNRLSDLSFSKMLARTRNPNAIPVATAPSEVLSPQYLLSLLLPTHTLLSVIPFSLSAMASPDVVAPALLLTIPLVSLLLSVYNWLVHRSTPIRGAILLLLTISATVSGGTALSVACGDPLRVVAKVFTNLLHATCRPYCSLPPLSHICDLASSVWRFYIRSQSILPDARGFPPSFPRILPIINWPSRRLRYVI